MAIVRTKVGNITDDTGRGLDGAAAFSAAKSTLSVDLINVGGGSASTTFVDGTGGNDFLLGTPDNDFFDLSQGGDDLVAGFDGADYFYFGAALTAADQTFGGNGRDTLALQGTQTVTFGALTIVDSEILALLGSADNRFGGASGTPFTYNITLVDANVAIGAALTIDGRGLSAGDTMTVNGAAEATGSLVFFGGSGNDTLTGGGGNDTFIGGAGNDASTGGAGDDVYFVDAAGDTVTELVGGGFDAVYSSVSYTLSATASVELLATADSAAATGLSLTGSNEVQSIYGNAGANFLSGLGGDDFLYGLGGDDTLTGGTGADSLVGGTGNDRYFVDQAGDQVVENAGEGFDQVYTDVTYALLADASVELLAIGNSAGATAINLTGSSAVQSIYGNAGNNALSGLGGDDFLYGLDGNDTLTGGTGADYMIGGLGNDRYFVDQVGDVVLENVGEGFDEVYTDVSYTLAPTSSIELFAIANSGGTAALNLTGSDVTQSIYGNAGGNFLYGLTGDDFLYGLGGNDTLIGGTGADYMIGGVGDDRYFVDVATDRVLENAGEGFDQVYSDVSYTLTATSSIELLATGNSGGTTAIDLIGSSEVQSIYGNNGANTLSGLGGNDFLYGYAGNDLLIGGAGADVLAGGAGNDTFRYTATSDSPLAGFDRINDFATGDMIDLSAIDANTNNGAGNDAFTFIGSAAFSGTAGELRAVFDGAKWAVQGDTNGDGAADLAIVVYTTDAQPIDIADFWP